MRKKSKIMLLLLLAIVGGMSSEAQVTITGPTCVVPGTVYQYTISGTWDSVSTMKVCVGGGVIADSADSNACTLTGAPIARVLVNWDSSGSGLLTVTSSIGNGNLHVSITTALASGMIDSTTKTQLIGYDSIPPVII
jgi:hypothetical protein